MDEIDANRVVSYNLRLAREMQGLTQEQFATRLEAITGHRPTQASISALERSWEGGRRREFDAQELVEFAVALNVPIAWFFLPPPDDRREIKNTGRVLLALVDLLVGRAQHQPRIEERLREVGLRDYAEQEEISRMLTGQPDRITPQVIREFRERMLTQLLDEMATELDDYAEQMGAFWDRVRQVTTRGVIASLTNDPQLLGRRRDLPEGTAEHNGLAGDAAVVATTPQQASG
ncbi:MAG: helix-turn-helix transcriptional regulator [Acidimicrobiaceae bacterium]|nr:helix-turn-helix transcriptional regulator [Acidimicrobiaceae bacterium]MDE0515129.1 helix-turn-helix transcriptional regulator [Acidimicrobiaceae bacterium]